MEPLIFQITTASTELLKSCAKCQTVKPLTYFYKSTSCHGGYKTECKECTRAMHRDYLTRNPGYKAFLNQRYNLKRAAAEGRPYHPYKIIDRVNTTVTFKRGRPSLSESEKLERARWRNKERNTKRLKDRAENMDARVPPCCIIHREHSQWRPYQAKTQWICLLCSEQEVIKKDKLRPPMPESCSVHGKHEDWKVSASHTWWCQKCTRAKEKISRKRRLKSRRAKYLGYSQILPRQQSTNTYYLRNRSKILAAFKDRHKNDPAFRMKNNIRRRVRDALRLLRIKRSTELIGCHPAELRPWIQRQFSKRMRWNNYGKIWVVDHIQPLASFDLTDKKQLLQACHYTNLRPLLSSDNADKSDKITVPQLPLMLPLGQRFPLALGSTCQFPVPDSPGRVTVLESIQVGEAAKVMRCEASNSAA